MEKAVSYRTKQFISILVYFSSISFGQILDSGGINIYSNENRLKFADYLFCQHDYLRAKTEYDILRKELYSDTLNYKIASCYFGMGNYPEAISQFLLIPIESSLFILSRHKMIAARLLQENYELIYSDYNALISSYGNDMSTIRSLYAASLLFSREAPINRDWFLESFDEKSRLKAESFFYRKTMSGYKSESLAGIFSAIIPGTGKIYVGNYGDGILALISTGLLGYIAYNNFKADRKFRGWVFTGLSVYFYAGNIYGSIASAQIFNAKADFDFYNDLKLFLKNENYFLPCDNFCKD